LLSLPKASICLP